ncbi:hypothetical protein JQC92_14285 [Shewanella sp. 202IG2-18]|uniref:hypothetical protein n=1 Tax=Parashewanella hymeniacidonis TaxID=2807618 RepID=UPI00196110FB|nr:hypothetical protein [Parashewanella hymeniacidonis]MBM7073181.1 hypothetical protein [Parashewanella hymeniacidonis]
MQELNMSEVKEVNGGALTWDEGKNAILALGVAGLTVGTGGAGLFGLAIWAAMAYSD